MRMVRGAGVWCSMGAASAVALLLGGAPRAAPPILASICPPSSGTSPSPASCPPARPPAGPPQEPSNATHLLIVTGLGGEPKYSGAFYQAAIAMANAARERFGLPDSAITYLAEDPARDPERIRQKSTKENVEHALTSLAGRARPGDHVFILLIGHGSQQSDEPRFNLPGPDITASDFARLLKRFRAQRIAFVNASSASGDFLPALSGKDRVIITATKTGLERNETMFGQFFVDAFAGDGADVDKDGRVSLLEAFDYARREVARAYEEENRLLTEHAQLDDNGDGRGSTEPDPRSADGALSRRLFLSPGRGTTVSAADNPALTALHQEREKIEARIHALRKRKDKIDPATYERELETLLVELALKNQSIRRLQEKKQ